MNLYMVKITTYAVISSDNENNAKEIADDEKLDILSDDGDPTIQVLRKIENIKDIPNGWDSDCLPYGGDGFTTIKELLSNVEVK